MTKRSIAPARMARLLAGGHPVLRLRLVRADRSGARRSGAAGLCRRPLLAVHFVAMLVFGYRDWSRRGEFLSVFFAMVARFAIVERDDRRRPAQPLLAGRKAARRRAVCRPAASLSCCSALSSVSFDGLSKTFFWLGLFGINPLEYPGRTALIGISSFGLVLTFVAAGGGVPARRHPRPASCRQPACSRRGCRPAGLVDRADRARLSFRALSDGAAGQRPVCAGRAVRPVRAGLEPVRHRRHAGRSRHRRRRRLGLVAVECAGRRIIAGHMLAVLVAHGLAWRLHPVPSRAALSQLPLTVLMIAYTVFGLWLLSTPTAG